VSNRRKQKEEEKTRERGKKKKIKVKREKPNESSQISKRNGETLHTERKSFVQLLIGIPRLRLHYLRLYIHIRASKFGLVVLRVYD
jgi:hypothetical protein